MVTSPPEYYDLYDAKEHIFILIHWCRDITTGEDVTHEADALVFAVGVTGMQKLVQASPALGKLPEFQRIMNLRGVDVVSTRLWLDKRVQTQFPANVLAGFDESMGSTYFNLNDLHVCYHPTCCELNQCSVSSRQGLNPPDAFSKFGACWPGFCFNQCIG